MQSNEESICKFYSHLHAAEYRLATPVFYLWRPRCKLLATSQPTSLLVTMTELHHNWDSHETISAWERLVTGIAQMPCAGTKSALAVLEGKLTKHFSLQSHAEM